MRVSLAKSVEKLVDSCPQKDSSQWPTYSKNVVLVGNAKTLPQKRKEKSPNKKLMIQYAHETIHRTVKFSLMILRKMTEKRLRLIAQSLDVSDYINSSVCSRQIEEDYFNGLQIVKESNSIRRQRPVSTADRIELRLSPDRDWSWVKIDRERY